MAGEDLGLGTWGGILAGLGAAGAMLYKLWRDNKSEAKGDNVDERIERFTSALQAQLDKAILRADALQTSYNAVVLELASAKARAETLAYQNERLLEELQTLRALTNHA